MDRRKKAKALHKGAFFRLSRFSEAYRSRLLAGVKDLDEYCMHENGLSLGSLITDRSQIDRTLGDYVLVRHSEKKRKQLGLVKQCSLRGATFVSWSEGQHPDGVGTCTHLGRREGKQASSAITFGDLALCCWFG